MVIRFKTQGGLAFFPGKTGEVTVDTESLSLEQRSKLEHALQQAHFFERAEASVGGDPRARDTRTYTITAQDGARHKTLAVSEPVPSDLQDLVGVLRQLTSGR